MEEHKFDLDGNYWAQGQQTAETRIGEIYHVRRNHIGSGSVSTPIAKYFVWRPPYIEGVNSHWRIDCFVRKHKFSGNPKRLAKLLTSNLQDLGLCDCPIWVSWYKSEELGGEKVGHLFEEC